MPDRESNIENAVFQPESDIDDFRRKLELHYVRSRDLCTYHGRQNTLPQVPLISCSSHSSASPGSTRADACACVDSFLSLALLWSTISQQLSIYFLTIKKGPETSICPNLRSLAALD
jgi:hypothetical protein